MTISITKSSRIVALAVGAGLVLAVAFGGFAAPAFALTQAEATTIIQVLGLTGSQAAAIQALVTGGSSSSSSCAFTRSLTTGATGSDVTCLQQSLISMGFSIPAGATGYFGSQTQAAVSAWQSSKGVSPAVGYFGPISQAAWSAMGGGSTGGTTGGTTGGSLSGGAGSITDADYVGNLNNEKVGEDESDVEVAGLDVEADEGSDIMITALSLNFSPGNGVGSNDFEDYADDVSVWVDGKEYARVDADQFTDDKNFDRTVSLKSGAVIKAGDRGDIVVAVSGIKNLDSTDAGDTWSLEFESVRFQDAQGASVTDNSTGDINDGSGRNFTFDTFATASDVELKATALDNTPDGVINVDDTSDTDGVELLRFSLEASGGDIRVKDLPITFATSSSNTSGNLDQTLADIASTVYLIVGSKEYSENASSAVAGSAGASVTFDDADFTISEGDKVTVIVKADINDTEANVFTDGDQLTASFTASNRGAADAEDETGENLASGDKTGTGLGDAVAFYDIGIDVAFVSASETVVDGGSNAYDGTGTFTIKFSVTAFDGTVYVSDNAEATIDTDIEETATDENLYRVDQGGSPTVENLSDVVSYTTGNGASDSANGNIQLEDGESTTVTLTVSRTNDTSGDAGLFQAFLMAIAWDTVDNSYVNASDIYNVFDFNLEDYKTDPVSIN